MREIKFRAWMKESKKWYGPDIKWFPLRSLLNEEGCSDDLIFMQFTGLHDRKGKEIWEGDIVIPLWVVNWSEELFGWNPFVYNGGGEMMPEEVEVVGNIYENPDLLDTKEKS